MINRFISLIKNPYSGSIFLVIILFFIPFLVASFLGDSFIKTIEIFLITFIIIIVFFEFIFRFFYRLYYGKKYQFVKKIPFEKINVEPHPYLPYILKKKIYISSFGKTIFSLEFKLLYG